GLTPVPVEQIGHQLALRIGSAGEQALGDGARGFAAFAELLRWLHGVGARALELLAGQLRELLAPRFEPVTQSGSTDAVLTIVSLDAALQVFDSERRVTRLEPPDHQMHGSRGVAQIVGALEAV